jgi:hypothetical protein
MNGEEMRLIDRIADRVDLAVDFLTLGQYGLAEAGQAKTSARDAGCEGGGPSGRREALPPARGRGCRGLGRPTSPQPAG